MISHNCPTDTLTCCASTKECKRCDVVFKTARAVELHMQQFHARDQNLTCNFCGMHFIRAGGLVAHYEHGQCSKITKVEFDLQRDHWYKQGLLKAEEDRKDKEERRQMAELQAQEEFEKAVEQDALALEQAEQSRWDLATVVPACIVAPTSPGSIDGGEKFEFGRKSSMAQPDNEPLVFEENPIYHDGWGADDGLLNLADDFPRLKLRAYRHGDSKAPDLLTDDPDPKENAKWAASKAFKTVSPEILPAICLMSEVPKESLTAMAEKRPYDPQAPGFDPQKYWNKFTSQYRCPHLSCK